MLECKNIDFPQEYCQIHHLLQTAGQIKADKKEKKENYSKTSDEYISELTQVAENLRNEQLTNLILETAGATDSIIVDGKPTFEEWFIDAELSGKNITVSEKSFHKETCHQKKCYHQQKKILPSKKFFASKKCSIFDRCKI